MKQLTVREINALSTDTRYELAKAVRMPDTSMLGDEEILTRLLAMTVHGFLTVENEAMEALLSASHDRAADTKPQTDPVRFFYGSHREAYPEFVGLTVFDAIEQLRPSWNIDRDARICVNGCEISFEKTANTVLSAADRVELSTPASEKA